MSNQQTPNERQYVWIKNEPAPRGLGLGLRDLIWFVPSIAISLALTWGLCWFVLSLNSFPAPAVPAPTSQPFSLGPCGWPLLLALGIGLLLLVLVRWLISLFRRYK